MQTKQNWTTGHHKGKAGMHDMLQLMWLSVIFSRYPADYV
jgi:hypothetical protein